MAVARRLAPIWFAAMLATYGLVAGAGSQDERFLQPDAATTEASNEAGAAGTLIPLTAILASLGAAWLAVALSNRPLRKRLPHGVVIFAASYALVWLLQMGFPNYDVFPAQRQASLSINPLIHDGPGLPSVLLPVFALVTAALLAAAASMNTLFARPTAPAVRPRRLLARHVAATALATPFLAITFAASIRLLVTLPGDTPGLQLHMVLLPAIAFGCLVLLVTALAKTWHLGAYVENAHVAGISEEAWTIATRVEWAAAGIIAVAAICGSLLPAAELAQLELGRTLVMGTRGHHQGLGLVLFAVVPTLWLQRPTLAMLRGPAAHGSNLELGRLRGAVLGATLAVVAALGVAVATTWLQTGALVPWVAALAPALMLALVAGERSTAALVALIGAVALWGMGNTVVAYFADSALRYSQPPGVLALWRFLAAALAAHAIARVALATSTSRRRSAVPLAMVCAIGAALPLLIELPVGAWVLVTPTHEFIAVGSSISSQAGPVRMLLHGLAYLASVAAATGLAALLRPEWFARGPNRAASVPAARWQPASEPHHQ